MAISARTTPAGVRQDGSDVAVTSSASGRASDGRCWDEATPCGHGNVLRCYDLARSTNHCGACGHACPPGIACQGGTCQQHRCQGKLRFAAAGYTATADTSGSAYAPAAGDFDGDGILDLVGLPPDGASSLLYGAGDGTFPTYQVVDSSRYWKSAIADVDGDGLLDLASITPPSMRATTATVSLRRGTGDRRVAFSEAATYPTIGPAQSVLLADFDADGLPDLVVGERHGFEYWRGQGGGSFEQQANLAAQDDLAEGTLNQDPAAMDWDGDGNLDLVYMAGSTTSANLHYRLGDGNGSFAPEVTCSLAAGVVGVDRDHRPDLVTRSHLLLGIEGCHASKIVPLADAPRQGAATLADLSGDGNLDIVADDDTDVTVRVTDGQGGFSQSLSLATPTVASPSYSTFLFGDLDQDGRLDLIFARPDGWGVFLNTCP